MDSGIQRKAISSSTPLYSFQENAVRRFLAGGALLLAHDVGMGKTRTALESIRRVAEKVAGISGLIVVPANLRTNFLDNARLFAPELDIGIVTERSGLSAFDIPIVSYDFLRVNIDSLARRCFDIVVCDEFHHGKNRATGNHACLSRLRTRTDRFLCLTGSPLQNTVNEFWNLLDLVAGAPVSPKLDACLERMWDLRKVSFLRRFYYRVVKKKPLVGPMKGIARPREFHRLAGNWIDFQSPGDLPDGDVRPGLREQVIRTGLSSSEWVAYQYAVKKVDRNAAAVSEGLLSEHEIRKVISSLAMARQALLSPDAIREKVDDPAPSGKLSAIAANLEGAFLPALVFSNFHEFGAKVIHSFLERRGFRSALIYGGTSAGDRERIKGAFDSGEVDVLVLSPVGGEGLGFPCARSVHIADPHWNPEVTRQMIGRALRLDSTVAEVHAFHYHAFGPKGEKTVDETISRIAAGKDRFNRAIRAVIVTEPDNDELLLFERRTGSDDS